MKDITLEWKDFMANILAVSANGHLAKTWPWFQHTEMTAWSSLFRLQIGNFTEIRMMSGLSRCEEKEEMAQSITPSRMKLWYNSMTEQPFLSHFSMSTVHLIYVLSRYLSLWDQAWIVSKFLAPSWVSDLIWVFHSLTNQLITKEVQECTLNNGTKA